MKTIGIILIVLASFGMAYGEETYTITGDVSFKYDGDIYICICTSQEWADFQKPGHELSVPPCKKIKMDSKLKKTGIAKFKLDNIPKGTYVIVAYQDANNNKMVDFENYMMNEPYGTYKETDPVSCQPSWSYSNFSLDKNIEGIKIEI